MNSKNIRGLSKRATYLGLIGQIIGTPLGTYAGYKGVSKLTDNKALRILGAIAGGIAGNKAGDYLGHLLTKARYNLPLPLNTSDAIRNIYLRSMFDHLRQTTRDIDNIRHNMNIIKDKV